MCDLAGQGVRDCARRSRTPHGYAGLRHTKNRLHARPAGTSPEDFGYQYFHMLRQERIRSRLHNIRTPIAILSFNDWKTVQVATEIRGLDVLKLASRFYRVSETVSFATSTRGHENRGSGVAKVSRKMGAERRLPSGQFIDSRERGETLLQKSINPRGCVVASVHRKSAATYRSARPVHGLPRISDQR